MPNNLQILAYIQAMKDRINENIKIAAEYNSSRPSVHLAYLRDINNLEKFIKGGN